MPCSFPFSVSWFWRGTWTLLAALWNQSSCGFLILVPFARPCQDQMRLPCLLYRFMCYVEPKFVHACCTVLVDCSQDLITMPFFPHLFLCSGIVGDVLLTKKYREFRRVTSILFEKSPFQNSIWGFHLIRLLPSVHSTKRNNL
jgi:hypothetical protein